MIQNFPPFAVFGLICFLFVIRTVIKWMRDPLRDVPGPFFARFTRLWYLKQARSGEFERINIALHEKHG